ncbi:hypothetical protein L1987_71661 [Smallanthus sonchifolius]|uniref:Uncharacterized protein n=1 Tax=Smallanthus sonchifolius TaxID=185202 RepID=A0ACB9AT27_9ASTR|nr:hypothetical protein L1987_71661 [Smallanthus sonchifolius]
MVIKLCIHFVNITHTFSVLSSRLEKPILRVFPGLMSPGSFLPLFVSLVDLPVLTVALEKVEKSSIPLIGSSIATIQKSAAPEMLLALMDEAYTDPLFLELLKDENDGLAVWKGMDARYRLHVLLTAISVYFS